MVNYNIKPRDLLTKCRGLNIRRINDNQTKYRIKIIELEKR